jgi:nucleoside-diphosphate-sugar epimerase
MRILVTGAGGLIGCELVGVLSGRGHGVIALQHRSTALRRNDGTPIPSAPWAGHAPGPGAVLTLPGDVRRPGLGLDAAAQAAVGDGLDLAIHCAALTSFNLDPPAYQAVNVGGIANLIAYTDRPRTPLLHVSTAYVCGLRDGPIREDELDAGQVFANGYEASKADGERQVAAARSQGRRIAVARPSVVVGASGDGVIGAFGSFYGMLRLAAEGRISVLPARPGASLDLVPIDHVVAGLVDIAERMAEAAGRTFHLVSGAPVPVAGLLALRDAYPQLHAPRFVSPEAFDPGVLTPTQQQVHAQATGLLAGYLQRDPRFSDANLRALSGRACPPTDGRFLRRLIDHCLAAGYIQVRRGAAA